jgi:Protein of unknown function (DUF3570)
VKARAAAPWHREAAVAATRKLLRLIAQSLGVCLRIIGLTAGALSPFAARAVELPADQAEAMLHVYKGGGVTATGPALLVRKSLADKVSISGSTYVDMVSNASIDVVTTASPFRETRTSYDLGLDYVVRDTSIKLGRSMSREPDYTADALSLDLSQEVFGNMSTVSMGFTRAWDKVGRKDTGFFDQARHWQYRFGLTQVLSKTWTGSINFEAVADDGYLGSPYRVARVFGAAVPERNPRTRSSRALTFRSAYSLAQGHALRAEYRYFWDTWDIRAHTVELNYARSFGDAWLSEVFGRIHIQSSALFYSDNAAGETLYLSRNRQLSSFTSPGFGARLNYTMKEALRGHDLKFSGSLELKQFRYDNFSDIRTGQAYSHNAALLQFVVSANF